MQVKINAATERCRFFCAKFVQKEEKAKQAKQKSYIRLLFAKVRNKDKQGIDNKISAAV